jgi:hypothetical protein
VSISATQGDLVVSIGAGVDQSAVNHFGAYAGGIAGDFDMEFHVFARSGLISSTIHNRRLLLG